MFILVVVVGVTIVVVAYLDSKHGSGTSSISSQSLSQSTFSKLANSDSTVGNSGQVLTIQSSAIFAGKVLVRQDLEVAGNLQIGGTLALNDLSVAGTAQFSQVQINKNLSVAGNTSLQGAVTVAKSLQVSGSGSFSGPLSAPQLTTSSLQLNGDLTLTHHITAGGATPGRTNGGALGSGGTSSVSGSDTAGSITINTGGSPSAGCFLTVNFTAKYNSTPRVLVTPVGSSAGGLAYYVDRTAAGFSVCDATPPPAGASFGFDYFVVD
jgi:cytoskeletal protein CcmA (bactofilin family)